MYVYHMHIATYICSTGPTSFLEQAQSYEYNITNKLQQKEEGMYVHTTQLVIIMLDS